jgi:alanine dehydrogenase
MSEVAGRLAPQVGSWTLQKANGGRGVLLGGVAGVSPSRVLVIGGGVVGTQAAKVAAGMGADVTVLDRSVNRLRYLDDVFGGTFKNTYATKARERTPDHACIDSFGLYRISCTDLSGCESRIAISNIGRGRSFVER